MNKLLSLALATAIFATSSFGATMTFKGNANFRTTTATYNIVNEGTANVRHGHKLTMNGLFSNNNKLNLKYTNKSLNDLGQISGTIEQGWTGDKAKGTISFVQVDEQDAALEEQLEMQIELIRTHGTPTWNPTLESLFGDATIQASSENGIELKLTKNGIKIGDTALELDTIDNDNLKAAFESLGINVSSTIIDFLSQVTFDNLESEGAIIKLTLAPEEGDDEGYVSQKEDSYILNLPELTKDLEIKAAKLQSLEISDDEGETTSVPVNVTFTTSETFAGYEDGSRATIIIPIDFTAIGDFAHDGTVIIEKDGTFSSGDFKAKNLTIRDLNAADGADFATLTFGNEGKIAEFESLDLSNTLLGAKQINLEFDEGTTLNLGADPEEAQEPVNIEE